VIVFHREATRITARLIIFLALIGWGTAKAEPVQFNIPDVGMKTALLMFGQQAKLTVVLSPDVADRPVKGVVIRDEPLVVLQQLLEGSDLGFRQIGNDALVVERVSTPDEKQPTGDTKMGAETHKKSIFVRVLAAASALLIGSNNGPAAAEEIARSGVLEEIVVTAQKRSETLQEMPIAISVVSREAIEKANLSGVRDLKMMVPSLNYSETQGIEVYVSIRGIGSELRNIGAEPGVAMAQDGVPLSNQVLYNTDFFDLERVEVLRGPQGTINGRNSTGGAINIHSRMPTDAFEGRVRVTAGNYDRRGAEFILSGPVLDNKLLARLAIKSEQADGWLENTFLKEDMNGTDKLTARLALVSNLTESLEAQFVYERIDDDADIASTVDLGRLRPDVPGFAESFGVPAVNMKNYEYQADYPVTRSMEKNLASLRLAWDITPSTTITSITGYTDHDQNRSDDFDGTIIAGSHFDSTQVELEQWSQELTLTTDLSDRLDLIVGALYLQADAAEPLSFGLPLLGIPVGAFVLKTFQELESYAVYSQLNYDISEAMTLTLGGRYTKDKKDFSEDFTIFAPLGSTQADQSWSSFTPRLAIDYSPSDALTAYASISRGFKAGGFNSFSSLGSAANEFDPEDVWSYEAGLKYRSTDGTLRAALSAFYMDYADMQAALFLTDEATGISVQSVRNAASSTVQGIEMELEALINEHFRVRLGGTYLDASYDELMSSDPVFPELGTPDAAGTLVRDLSGNKIARAPEWQFNVAAEYFVPLSSNWNLTLAANYVWQDQIYFSFFNHPSDIQDSYGIGNISATLESSDGRWEVQAFSTNVFDEHYVLGAYRQNLAGIEQRYGDVGRPRMAGLHLGYRF